MMRISNRLALRNKKGFAPVAVVVIVLVIVAAGYAGWVVYDKQRNKSDTAQQQSFVTSETSNSQAPFTKASDIDASIKDLDKTQLDSDLSTSDIDADLNAVL